MAGAVSCGPSAGPSAPPEPVQSAGPAVITTAADPESTTPRGGIDEARAKDEAARILEAVAKARNLEVLAPVDVLVTSKKDIRAYAKETMYEHMTPAELDLQGRISASLGVIAIGASLEQVLLNALEDGVLGFYDPKKKALFIGDFISMGMLSQTVGHEIAHALQDMHFGLKDRVAPNPHHTDLDAAETFLIEGGAQAAYLAWVSGTDGLGTIDDAVLEAMVNAGLEAAGMMTEAPVLARSLYLPYTAGTATVVRMVVQDGWTSVDALYEDPPTTTEQMLHLDKLRAREPARPVELDHEAVSAAIGKPIVWHDDFGEAQLLALLADVESAAVARRSADGWGGDALLALEDASGMSVALVVTMDSRSDAEALEASLRKYVDERLEGTTALQRRRDTVLLATALKPASDTKAVAAALWAAVSVDGKPVRR